MKQGFEFGSETPPLNSSVTFPGNITHFTSSTISENECKDNEESVDSIYSPSEGELEEEKVMKTPKKIRKKNFKKQKISQFNNSKTSSNTNVLNTYNSNFNQYNHQFTIRDDKQESVRFLEDNFSPQKKYQNYQKNQNQNL